MLCTHYPAYTAMNVKLCVIAELMRCKKCVLSRVPRTLESFKEADVGNLFRFRSHFNLACSTPKFFCFSTSTHPWCREQSRRLAIAHAPTPAVSNNYTCLRDLFPRLNVTSDVSHSSWSPLTPSWS